MVTFAEINEHMNKLSPSQRNTMRRLVPGSIDALKVEYFGFRQLRVVVCSEGFELTVDLGSRGAVLGKPSLREI